MTRRVYKGQHIGSSGTEVLRDGTLAVDLTTNSLYIHDGTTAGGVLVPLPTVKTVNFVQVSTDLMTIDTVDITLGKVFEYTIYHDGSDSAYPTIGTSSEISIRKMTLIHDGTNVSLVGSAVNADTGTSRWVNNWSYTISGGNLIVKVQANTTYNTVKIIRNIY